MKTTSMKAKVMTGFGFAIAASVGLAAVPASATDFSCGQASNAAQRTICNHANLSALDDRMAHSYGRLWQHYEYRERLQLRSEQRRFLSFRDTCGRDVLCIEGAYLDQISLLDSKLAEVLDN